MNKHRSEIFNGKLYMPTIKNLRNKFGIKVYSELQNMFESMWFHYLKEGSKGTISLPYWAKRINNTTAMNIALTILSKNGWITSRSIPNNNWGEAFINESKILEYVTIQELEQIRKQYKFAKYILRHEEPATQNKFTRINGSIKDTGLIRNGFMKSGNTEFYFDIQTMEFYKNEVIKLVNKGILKMMDNYPNIRNDLANYEEVGKEVIEHYIWNNGTYTAGQNNNDSRGRNISGMLNKIGNPIGFKIMRALLVIPEEKRNTATKEGLTNKYLFIAELLGYKEGTTVGKANYGRRAYYNRETLDLELPKDIEKLYENIWIERMYDEIDLILGTSNWKKKSAIAKYRNGSTTMTATAKKIETFELKEKWYIPIEIDMSASILGIMGLLMAHKPFMTRTNMIGRKIQDAWKHEVVTNRIQFKTIMRVCYGSGMSASEMWSDMNINYTENEVLAFNHELESGSIAVANKFKDFIINNSKTKEKMTLKVDNEFFKVECNKHYNIGETTNKFDFYDTYSNSIRRIHNTETVKKPDLKSFRRFLVTGLIHNLDSQVEDNTVNEIYDDYKWIIDIHDAMILDAEATNDAKNIYCSGKDKTQPSLERIFKERNNILSKYFTSIGIKNTKLEDWNTDVNPHIEKYKGTFKCNRIVLK